MNRKLDRKRIGIGIATVCLVSVVATVFNPNRKLPLHELFNPYHWVEHYEGRDIYDARWNFLGHGDPHIPEVAMTFDDGPDINNEPAIVKVLKEKHVPATFFLVGIRIKQHPELVKLLADNGFGIGNHTYDHKRLDALKPHEIANELRLCDKHIFEITGKHPFLMRPPGMQYNNKVLNVARALGYVTVYWNVGARDYEVVPKNFIVERVIDRTENGSIILLHQDQPSTAQALPEIIDGLRAQGYTFVSLPHMLRQLHVQIPPVPRD